jgi:hypothetical protein
LILRFHPKENPMRKWQIALLVALVAGQPALAQAPSERAIHNQAARVAHLVAEAASPGMRAPSLAVSVLLAEGAETGGRKRTSGRHRGPGDPPAKFEDRGVAVNLGRDVTVVVGRGSPPTRDIRKPHPAQQPPQDSTAAEPTANRGGIWLGAAVMGGILLLVGVVLVLRARAQIRAGS